MEGRVRQPEYFFKDFLNAIRPTIDAFSPAPWAHWWIPYGRLLGRTRSPITQWKSWKRVPENVYQNAQNLLALQQIALLPPDASLDQARSIASSRLSDALSGTCACLPSRPSRWPLQQNEDKTWRALELYGQGWLLVDIAREIESHPDSVSRMIRRVTGKPLHHPRVRWDTERAQRLLDEGRSLADVANDLGQPYDVIWQYFRRRRSRQSA
jgi:AraC-like DNA-binding protein